MDNNKPSTRRLGKAIGQSGTIINSGQITSEEYNYRLTGKAAIRQYEIMRRSDSTVHSALQMVKLPLLGLERDIEAASDDEFDQEVAAFIKRELFERNVNFHDFMRQIMTCFDFGFSVAEKTYELTTFNGKTRVGIAELGFRKQTSIFSWETENKEPGITQQLIAKTVSIPEEKLLVFSTDKEGDNYQGISLLRYAFKDWDIKDKLILVNAIGLEKLSMGIPVVEFDTNVSEKEKEAARNYLRQMRANEEAYLEKPKGSTVEMLDMKASSTKDVLPTIKYHDRQILLSVLGQFLDLGSSSGSGSRAVGDVQSDLFMLSEEAANKFLMSVVQEQLIKQLCDLNYSELPNGYPKLTSGHVKDDDVQALADAYQKFSSANLITPEPELEQHIRKQLGAPDLPEDLRKDYEERRKAEKPEDKKTVAKNGKNLDEEDEDDNVQAAAKKARQYNRQLIDTLVS